MVTHGHRKTDGWMQGLQQTDPCTVHTYSTYEQTSDGPTLQTERNNSPPHTHNGGFEKQQFTSTWPQRKAFSPQMQGNCKTVVQQSMTRLLPCQCVLSHLEAVMSENASRLFCPPEREATGLRASSPVMPYEPKWARYTSALWPAHNPQVDKYRTTDNYMQTHYLPSSDIQLIVVYGMSYTEYDAFKAEWIYCNTLTWYNTNRSHIYCSNMGSIH